MKKKFGQNFLRDKNILSKIESLLPNIESNIVEIGGGDGALTRILMKKYSKVVTIEIDKDYFSTLKAINKNTILFDAMKYDFTLHKDEILIANLPYNISVPLLMQLIINETFSEYYVMLQREVALRFAAQVSSSDYGRVSVLTQYNHEVKIMIPNISPASFYPSPKVYSSFIYIKRKGKSENIEKLDLILRKAFSLRRKKLSNSLEIDCEYKNHRPQDLSVKDWVILLQKI